MAIDKWQLANGKIKDKEMILKKKIDMKKKMADEKG